MSSRYIQIATRLAKPVLFALTIAGAPQLAQAANPFLPSYEYIPDGEPRVFGDRVYLYGSHDKAGSERFCDYILKVWSAPLNNLNEWTDHGIALASRDVEGRKDDIPFSDYEFYAPDLVEHNGKYYIFAQVVGSPCSIAVSYSPSGPFEIIGQVKAPEGESPEFGGWSQYFDPGVLIDDDGKIYLYFGGGHSAMVQLNPDNITEVLPNTLIENIIPQESPFDFQEGISPRKINDTYYLVYARGLDLAYATSESPTGPFDYRGVIVSQRIDAHGGNIHGGLENLNGRWHIFYHRQTNNTVFSRRACTERVSIEADGSIKLVEQTSLGFEDSLDPYQLTPADIACVFRGGSYVTEWDKRTQPILGNKSGCVVGYKYFDFGAVLPSQKTSVTIQYRDGAAAGNIEVWIGDPDFNGEKIGSVSVERGLLEQGLWRETTIPVRNIEGRHAIYLKFTSETSDQPIADLRSFVFTRDTL